MLGRPSGATLGRMLRAAALIGCVALAVIASPVADASSTSTPGLCTVRIYFTIPATTAQMAAVKARVRSDKHVQTWRFVTRKQALEEQRKKFPDLTNALPYNPFPARIDVRLKPNVDQESFIARY